MRIAASTYLNSAPLVVSLADERFGARYRFLGDTAPARCAAMLAENIADIALIPVIEYQRIPDLFLLPDIAVAAKHQVRSVLLAARKPLAEVETLALDASSRTSQALARIILAERYGLHPRLLEHISNVRTDFSSILKEADAALVIGDPAMRFAAQADALGLQIYDLAEMWRALTRLPFVFAFWAIRADALAKSEIGARQLVQDFLTAKQEGLAQMDELARRYAQDLRLPVADLLDYLRVNVNYDLDSENRAGLQQYFALAVKHGLLAEAQPLRFLQQANGVQA
jgi:chorismate dehydratase